MIFWKWLSFESMTPHQLYDALQLREAVFTFDQACTDCDIDGLDKKAIHLLAYDQEILIGYLRVYEKDQTQIIGRIVVNPSQQGQGIGRQMILEALRYLQEKHPNHIIEMSAQTYLETFYVSLGFETVGESYLEGGIKHIKMCLTHR